MFVWQNNQLDLLDSWIPEELRQLPDELVEIGRLLDDERYTKELLPFFSKRMGRKTIPLQTFLRLMYLKHRYGMGYETLVERVKDSIQWRQFCQIGIYSRVPDASSLIKLNHKLSGTLPSLLNEILVQKALEEKTIRARTVRIDTTVIEAEIHYPTDSGLLHDGIRAVTRLVKEIQQAGVATKETFRDRTRSAKKRILSIVKVLKRRSGEAVTEAQAITGQLVEQTQQAIKQATKVIEATKAELQQTTNHQVERAVAKLQTMVSRTERVIEQTQQVLAGTTSIPNRLVSLHNPDARPIVKGKLGKKVEYGHKVLIVESKERVITYFDVLPGNPSDTQLLVGAVEGHQQTTGRIPKEVAADRGFSDSKQEETVRGMGANRVAIPKRGKKSQKRTEEERTPAFRRLQRFRAGGEGSIGVLKGRYGLDRCRASSTFRTEGYTGYGILAYNLHRIAELKAK